MPRWLCLPKGKHTHQQRRSVPCLHHGGKAVGGASHRSDPDPLLQSEAHSQCPTSPMSLCKTLKKMTLGSWGAVSRPAPLAPASLALLLRAALLTGRVPVICCVFLPTPSSFWGGMVAEKDATGMHPSPCEQRHNKSSIGLAGIKVHACCVLLNHPPAGGC